jgi:isocitrate dehydrogenase (NAD+)
MGAPIFDSSVTAVDKANIVKLSDGLFRDCCRAVAKGFPEVG